MLIWVLIIGVFAILGATGYLKGAIRSLVSLVGLFLALMLTGPLSPPLRPLVPKVGLAHPVWTYVAPPLTVFLVLVLLFEGLSFLAHYKLAQRFKYSADDVTRIRWERLNRRLGVAVGCLAAGVYSLLAGLIVYVLGYPAVQVTGDEAPLGQRWLSQARQQLHESGLDKSLAGLDPMPENYYLASDLIGLIYQNDVLQDRLLNYPPFLGLSQRQEFQDIITDVDLLQMFKTRGSFVAIANHPKIVAVIGNAEIVQELKQVDLKDLYQYLKTGKSAKYDEEKLLGKWKLDLSATLVMEKRKRPDMTAAEMARIRKLITVFLPNISLLATPDNKALVKMELTEEAKRIVAAAQAAAQAATQTSDDAAPQPRMDPRMRARYGGYIPQAAAAPPPKPKVAIPGLPQLDFASQGTWQREGEKYKLKLQDEKGKSHSADATADDERLVMSYQGHSLVFAR